MTRTRDHRRCEREFARVKVYRVSRLDPTNHPSASQCARAISHGLFYPSDEFHQRHEGGVHQGVNTIRADDHTASSPIRTIVFRDGHLWHERERDQRLAAPDVGAGCCVSRCWRVYLRDSFPLEMEADLKVGCLITVLDYDLQIGVWDVRGEWSGGGKASQVFRYHSHLSPGA